MICVKGMLFLMVDVVLRLLSVSVPYLLLELKTGKKTSRMAKAVLFVMAVLGYFCVRRVLLGHFNVVRTMKRIVFGDFTYQSMIYLPVSVAILTLGVILLVIPLGAIFAGRFSGAGNRDGIIRKLFVTATSVLLLSIGALVYVSLSGVYKLKITEVNPNSEVIFRHQVYGNYIELYNGGAFDCELKGLFLSDDADYLKKYRISDTKMQKNAYMVVEIANDIFSIKKSGSQTFYLSDETGSIISSVTTEKINNKKSFSLMIDGNWSVAKPTPLFPSNAVNQDEFELEYTEKVEVPLLSREAGFYDEPFNLEIMADKGCKIYYTTDGSLPTLDSEEYDGKIYVYDRSSEDNVFLAEKRVEMDYNDPDKQSAMAEKVDKAFILRAIAVDEDGKASKPVTATYFVDKDKYVKYAVVSVVADPEELYGEDGIYVTGKAYDEWYLGNQEGDAPAANFLGRGKGYEIPASFEFWDDESSFVQEIGLRVAGGSTRYGSHKKLSFFARKEYSGKPVFNYQIFDGIYSHRLSIGGGYINPIVMRLAKDRDVATHGATRANIFVNGEFYGQTSLIEKYDEQFFSQHYGVDKKDVLIMKADEIGENTEADMEWQKIYDFLESNDLSENEAYRAFGEMIDIQSYIDYMCIRTYIDDSDFNEKKNFFVWKTANGGENSSEINGSTDSESYADGRWRWALFDLDFMESGDYAKYGYECQAQKNSFVIVGEFVGGQSPYDQPIFQGLYKNAEFRKQFRESFIEIANTTFDYEKVVDCIEEYGTDLEEYGASQDLDYYLDFFRDRAKYIVPYMEEKFGE